ncbi:hypothetical protein [Psychrobacter sp. I-STPA10]|uniref:hypothetical protein n=1 Tax=Psychrobacter sp. I-STPA10 TaxID=2585769 RepID=UPI001E2849B7|nr:hypothetical protein [Psychrobacter sp. I-STPA10]
MLSANNAQKSNTISTTNFDLPSLHLLRNEIDTALKNTEKNLSQFNDDVSKAPLLLDSIEVLQQITSVLNLISLCGGSDLAAAIAAGLQRLYDTEGNTDDELILDISEGVMTLGRYIEFVLLKETLEPSLLIPVINRINQSTGRELVSEESFSVYGHSSISIANPEQNYQPLSRLNLDIQLLSTAYRAGLEVALSNTDGVLSEQDKLKLSSMAQACVIPAKQSDCLFWQAAAAATKDLASLLPLTNPQKRTLIYLEQQFHDYLPATDRRFADLVSLACQREHELAQSLKQQYVGNRLDEQQIAAMKRFLFGPNREVTDTLNELIQTEISSIKEQVDTFARADDHNPSDSDAQKIAQKLTHLSSVLTLLDLPNASRALAGAAKQVEAWQTPTPEDFDTLLAEMMIAENAAIQMAKSHTPGAITLPLHDPHISLYQLDTAYETLIKQSRVALANVEQTFNAYAVASNDAKDFASIQDCSEAIQQVSGALRFLGLKDAANLLAKLTDFMTTNLPAVVAANSDGIIEISVLNYIANILMAVDYKLQGLENTQPVGTHAMKVGHHSLNKLLAAA